MSYLLLVSRGTAFISRCAMSSWIQLLFNNGSRNFFQATNKILIQGTCFTGTSHWLFRSFSTSRLNFSFKIGYLRFSITLGFLPGKGRPSVSAQLGQRWSGSRASYVAPCHPLRYFCSNLCGTDKYKPSTNKKWRGSKSKYIKCTVHKYRISFNA